MGCMHCGLSLGLGAHHGEPPKAAECLDIHQRDVGRLLRLIGCKDNVSSRLCLEDEHALARQQH